MPRHVVLLRGVNVGKGNRVPMAEFRGLLEELGHSDVKTLLNSGNAVYSATAGGDADSHAKLIAEALKQRFEVTTPVVVKAAAEFLAIAQGCPVTPPESEHSRFMVVFSSDPARLLELEALRALLLPGEQLFITPQAAYLHCAHGVLESKAGAALVGKAGRSLTTRNWATVQKIAALCLGPVSPR
ncbi:DUF1697 domain-containing protein [Ideonella sp.]|uniref:DUF1697 domain-containing protein n=1 Tax=Ideonella sp. TaxID=1929293 RepID=UPI003BB4B45A